MSYGLTSFAGVFVVDHIWRAAGLHIVAWVNRVQIERYEHGEAGEKERTPRCEVHDWACGAGIDVQTERDDLRREGEGGMEEKWEDLGEIRSLEGGFKSAALPPHTLRERHTRIVFP